jgi:hypothetical protein
MKRLGFGAILGVCLLGGAQLGAAVLLPATLEDLVTGAQTIVHGQVVAIEPRWTEGRRTVETLVTLRAAEYLKGNLGPEVTFKVPGGQMGPYRTFMVGAPTLAEGDEIVVFLNAQGPALPWIVGLSQGLFRVTIGDTGLKVITPGTSLASGEGLVRGDPARRPVSLGDFGDRVRLLVRERPR